jgi:hypothetical protein
MKRKNIKKRIFNEVKKKMSDDDFKKLFELNRERLVQCAILETAVGDERIECNKKIKKIKGHRVWVTHQIIINEFYGLYSKYDQIKLSGHEWTI